MRKDVTHVTWFFIGWACSVIDKTSADWQSTSGIAYPYSTLLFHDEDVYYIFVTFQTRGLEQRKLYTRFRTFANKYKTWSLNFDLHCCHSKQCTGFIIVKTLLWFFITSKNDHVFFKRFLDPLHPCTRTASVNFVILSWQNAFDCRLRRNQWCGKLPKWVQIADSG